MQLTKSSFKLHLIFGLISISILASVSYASAQSSSQSSDTPQASSGYGDPLHINVGMVQDTRDTQNLAAPAPVNVENPQQVQEIEVIGEGQRYTIGAGDILQITVRNQQDFSGRFVVNNDGYIQYNWVGDIKAAGYTKEELKNSLKESLIKYVRYPEVSVIIIEYKSKFVYVLGEVNRPGKYPMQGDNLTLREAVVMAGLPNKTSSMRRARVVRETSNGPQSIKVNLKDVLMKGKLEQNYDLMPGDIIVIPTSRYHLFTDAANKLVSPLFQAMAVYEMGFGEDENGIFFPDND